MDATRKIKGGGRALHVLEFVKNTVLSTSWLKLKPLPPRAKCFEISPCIFSEPVATVLWDGILRWVEWVPSRVHVLESPLRKPGVLGNQLR